MACVLVDVTRVLGGLSLLACIRDRDIKHEYVIIYNNGASLIMV